MCKRRILQCMRYLNKISDNISLALQMYCLYYTVWGRQYCTACKHIIIFEIYCSLNFSSSTLIAKVIEMLITSTQLIRHLNEFTTPVSPLSYIFNNRSKFYSEFVFPHASVAKGSRVPALFTKSQKILSLKHQFLHIQQIDGFSPEMDILISSRVW